MKRSAGKKRTKVKAKARNQRKMPAPLSFLLVLILTFGLSPIGKAAQKIRRAFRAKKSGLKASYSALLTARAWAYFRPGWQKDALADLPSSIGSMDKVVDDSDGRVDRNFRPSSALKARVRFWIEIYARFNSEYRIIHDKDNPEIIYGYLDFRALYRSMPRRMASARAYQIEQRVLKELKARIAEAAGLTRPRQAQLSPAEKATILDWLAQSDARDPQAIAHLLRRIRTQTGQKDHFLKALHRSERLLPQIEALFAQRGLPAPLARLPFVESSFNRGAFSKSGAIGIWQFLPETARRFAPSSTAKELADPMRQSRSAARMFEILHQQFDDWGIAVTAYNSGATRLKRMADKYGAHDIEALLKVPMKRDGLGFAGQNFFCELLAANLVATYKDQIFTSAELQIARLEVPRWMQSLLDSHLALSPAQTTPPPSTVAVKKRSHGKRGLRFVASNVESRSGKRGRRKQELRGSHKVRFVDSAKKSRSRRVAMRQTRGRPPYRPRSTARRA